MPPPSPERRSRQRVPARVPVAVKSSAGSELTASTRDLSSGGIFLYTDAPLAIGTTLEMVLVLPAELTAGEKRWVCCQGSVVRTEENVAEGTFGVAVSIQRLDVLPEIEG